MLTTAQKQHIMGFKKGVSGNPAGRKQGKKNKVTTDLKDWIADFIDSNREQIQLDWMALEARERIVMFEKLLKYAIPVKSANEVATKFDVVVEEEPTVIIWGGKQIKI